MTVPQANGDFRITPQAVDVGMPSRRPDRPAVRGNSYRQQGNFPENWKDSFPRLERMNSLIQAKYGSLTVDDIKNFLTDQDGYPRSMCRHEADSGTVASLIAEPTEGGCTSLLAARVSTVMSAIPCKGLET